MNINIREIESTDNPEIKSVIRTVLEEHGITMKGTAYWDDSLNEMYKFYSAPNSKYFVSILKGKLIGGAGIYPTKGLPEDTCELVKMYILPESRGLGIGKMLINKCINFARESGYKRIYLETMPELRKAIGMYENSGFKLIDGPMGDSGHFACHVRMLKSIDN